MDVDLKLIKIVGGDDLLNERLGGCYHGKGGRVCYLVERLDPLC